jgi:hypothetical protein
MKRKISTTAGLCCYFPNGDFFLAKFLNALSLTPLESAGKDIKIAKGRYENHNFRWNKRQQIRKNSNARQKAYGK